MYWFLTGATFGFIAVYYTAAFKTYPLPKPPRRVDPNIEALQLMSANGLFWGSVFFVCSEIVGFLF